MTAIAAEFCSTINPASASEPLRIAIAVPETGPWQSMGNTIRTAALLAVADHAARRAKDDAAPMIELTFQDDACSAERGALVAKQIAASVADARPVAIVGHACPSASQTAAPIYGAAGLVFIATESLPTRQMAAKRYGAHHFRMPGEASQGALIASALLSTPDPRIAIIRDRTQYAIEATQSISAGLGPKARNVILVEQIVGGEKDFAGLAQRLKTLGITHAVISLFPSEAGLLVTEMRKIDPDMVILATDQLADPEFPRIAHMAADGVLVPSLADYSKSPAAFEIIRKLGLSGAASTRAALVTYATLECLLATLDAQPRPTDADVARALQNGQFNTILGPLRFEADGAASLPRYGLFYWEKGRLVAATSLLASIRGVATKAPLP